jgi:hypothetical protein
LDTSKIVNHCYDPNQNENDEYISITDIKDKETLEKAVERLIKLK